MSSPDSTIVLAIRHTNGKTEVKPFADIASATREANRLGFEGGADVQRIGIGDPTVKQAWVARTYDVTKFAASLRK